MSILECEKCGNDYSSGLEFCFYCGHSTKKNFIDFTNDKKPKIVGDEELFPSPSVPSIILLCISLFAYWYCIDTYNSEIINIYFTSGLPKVLSIILTPFFLFLIVIFGISSSYKARLENSKEIYDFFKKNITLLYETPNEISEKEILTEKNKHQKILLFNVYMKAYLYNADAIVRLFRILCQQLIVLEF